MSEPRSLALPADLAGLVDRLRDQARATVRASQMLAEDKTIRNRIAGDADANYAGVTGYATPEWQAANAITALSARVAELEAARDAAIRKHSVAAAHNVIARRLALQDAAKVCDSAPIDAMAYDFGDAIRALSPTLDMDALTARAIEAAQSAYSGAPDSHSQNAANVARAVLSALLEGGE